MIKKKLSPWPFFSRSDAKKLKEILLSGNVNYWTGEECEILKRVCYICGYKIRNSSS